MVFGLWTVYIKYYNSFATVSIAILEGVGYYESKYS